MRTVFFLVPGIRTIPGDEKNWDGRGVTNLHQRNLDGVGQVTAEKVEYFATALLRPFFSGRRATKLAHTMTYYSDDAWRKVVVGHSNGCDVICDAFDYDQDLEADELHLVCGACEADFGKNGLNELLTSGRVRHIYVYIAGKDLALRLARTGLGKLLGYGTLGLHGPVNLLACNVARVTIKQWPEYGHSDCWSDKNFADTMRLFT